MQIVWTFTFIVSHLVLLMTMNAQSAPPRNLNVTLWAVRRPTEWAELGQAQQRGEAERRRAVTHKRQEGPGDH